MSIHFKFWFMSLFILCRDMLLWQQFSLSIHRFIFTLKSFIRFLKHFNWYCVDNIFQMVCDISLQFSLNHYVLLIHRLWPLIMLGLCNCFKLYLAKKKLHAPHWRLRACNCYCYTFDSGKTLQELTNSLKSQWLNSTCELCQRF